MLFRGLESKELIVNSKIQKKSCVNARFTQLRFYFGQNYLPTF